MSAYTETTSTHTKTTSKRNERPPPRESSGRFLIELGRAFAGAILLALPLMMTMEMWWLGFYIDTWRLSLQLLVAIPLLTLFSFYIGFRESFSLKENLLDAFVALAVGFVASGACLLLFSVLEAGMSWDEILGKIALQAVPASIGAVLAASQLGTQRGERKARARGYFGELVYMLVGSLFFALNLAPTDEIALISLQFTPWHGLLLMLASLLLIHVFVYNVEFRGQAERPDNATFWGVFLRFTVAGYAIALGMSLYVLWVFGRTDGLALAQILMQMGVLGFPASVGVAAARLIL